MKTVVIAEKPNVAKKLQSVIKDTDVNIVSARGHLLQLQYSTNEPGGKQIWFYPIIEDPDQLQLVPNAGSRDVLEIVARACKDADVLVSATDLDREGSSIFLEILMYLKSIYHDYNPKLKRMCYSSLTATEIKRAWSNLQAFDDGRSYAGFTRNIQDMQWGINLTRAMTLSTRKFSNLGVLSGGRVQTPMLKIINDRDSEISTYIPKEYYQLKLKLSHDDGDFEALYMGKITSMEQLMKIIDDIAIGTDATAVVKAHDSKLKPPPPFNGTSLQIEGNRVLGYTAQEIANRQTGLTQKLYESALVSYPGTDSEKYPPDWKPSDYDTFKNLLWSVLGGDAQKLMVNSFTEGKKTDEAHPCIRTTGVMDPSKFTDKHAKLYELITRRCACGSAPDAVQAIKNIFISIGKHKFKATGKTYVKLGWLEIYRYNIKDDKTIPDVKDGDTVRVTGTTHQKKETKAPPRYNIISLISQCDKLGLGTKNTRPGMVDKLVHRTYIEAQKHGSKTVLKTTALGGKVVEVLDNYAPLVTQTGLTDRFNLAMDTIENDHSQFKKQNDDMLHQLNVIMDEFSKNEDKIGSDIAGIDMSNSLSCTKCDKMMTLHESNNPDKSNFYGCTGYPDCDGTLFYHTEETVRLNLQCKSCGLPCVSGELWGKEYLRCMGDCDESPLRCPQCDGKVYVGKSKEKHKLYSLCKPCSLFSKFKIDFDRVTQ